MRYFSSTSISKELTWAREILEVVSDAGDDDAAQKIQAAIDQYQAASFSLAVLGKVKRGKSTLINALLGRSDDLAAPIDRLPASNTISHFRWSDHEEVDVYYRDGRRQRITLDQVRDFATEELNPGNSKNVEILDVAGPFEGLRDHLQLVDTPGAGSLHEYHDALLHGYIPQADAIIFLVTAQMPLDQDELDLLHKVKAADISKVFFAINRIDEATSEDLSTSEAHNRRLLEETGITVSKLYPISAKQAFQESTAESGIPKLLKDIQEFLQNEKGGVLRERLVSRVRLAAEPIVRRIRLEHACSSKSLEELTAERSRLTQENLRLQKERPLAEQEFRNRWESALQRFQHELEVEEKVVRKKIVTHVQKTPLTQINALVRELPTVLQEMIEEQLIIPRHELESSLMEATQHIRANYPQLRSSELEIHTLQASDDSTLAKGAAAGVSASALGGGLISAGGAVAANIAAANAAAAAATTTTVAAPTALGGILTTLFPQSAGLVATFLTGSASVSLPAAYTATPLWVALSGPVGWTMVGVGTLAIPFAWRISKLRAKDKLEDAVKLQVKEVFQQVRSERVAHLREMGRAIAEEFKLRSERQVIEFDSTLEQLVQSPNSTERIKQLAGWSDRIQGLLTPPIGDETRLGGQT